MRGIYGYIPLILVLVAGLSVAVFIRPISRWFKTNRAISIGAVIGHITHVEGSVRRLHGDDIELIPVNLEKPLELRDGDRIQTSLVSKADFNLEVGGGNFEIPEGSGILFQRWEPLREGSPVYMRVLFGSLNGASAKEHYVVKNQKLFFAGQKDASSELKLTLKLTQLPPARKLSETPPRPADDKINPETLSNEYLVARVEAAAQEFKGCWDGALKSGMPAPAGKAVVMVIRFEILKDGHTHSVAVEQNAGASENLNACVAQVFTRMGFRPFAGATMHPLFTLGFE